MRGITPDMLHKNKLGMVIDGKNGVSLARSLQVKVVALTSE